jgi:hypothetical protein
MTPPDRPVVQAEREARAAHVREGDRVWVDGVSTLMARRKESR